MVRTVSLCCALCATLTLAAPVAATPFSFTNGPPDGLMGMASRPGVGGLIEIEAADDFNLVNPTTLTGGTFTGLVTGTTPTIGEVVIEIYRIFPLDSNTVRTITVPTRANSPSDVELDGRDTAVAGQLSFTTTNLGAFNAGNSVLNGIHPSPTNVTGGEGAVRGNEVQFNFTLTSPIVLPPNHYFFIPQVQVTGGDFYWLSAPKLLPAPGDLQTWIRNAPLDPDWLRVGTDIENQGRQFNASFSLVGDAVPEPASLALLGLGVVALVKRRARRR